eukprot:SAG11_NODE_1822_length_4207_cov_1.736125_7_plen_80_part_00
MRRTGAHLARLCVLDGDGAPRLLRGARTVLDLHMTVGRGLQSRELGRQEGLAATAVEQLERHATREQKRNVALQPNAKK